MEKLKLNIKTTLTLIIIVVSAFGYKVQAQVTVGSNNAPAKAALLELKNREASNPTSVTDKTNVTSDEKGGGLGLPRVWLENKKNLMPFIPADADWNSNKDGIKHKHAGLMVYNINVSDGTTPADETFSQGIYVWDGTQWTKMIDGTAKKYFYIPAFNIRLEKGTGKECNLYNEYKKQFTKAGNPLFVSSNDALNRVPSPETNRLYNPNELDYAITYYDKNIIENVQVNANGLMTFDVISLDTSADSFLNVVFIVK